MQKKCRRCGDTFTVKTHEDYCPECEKVMTPPGAGVSKEITCEGCGKTFIHKKEKAQGRWPKYCPECLPKYSKVPKKKEVDVTLANMVANTLEESEVKVVEEDVINHPSHYTRGKIEVIDFIEDQQLPYHLGNVIKYIARAGYKGDKLEDLKKARWYLDRYINGVIANE
jgi:Zn finger protein HypA/HybF involved in hydrogenase expression